MEMRRKDREMDREFALGIVDKCEYATIAMCDEDGTPYCVPISPVRVENCLYFHSAMQGHKCDLLRQNKRVCVTCVGDTNRIERLFTTEFESAVLFGRSAEVTDEAEKMQVLRAFCQRHAGSNMAHFEETAVKSLTRTAIFCITIDEITGKRKKFDREGREMTFGRME